MSYYNIIKNDMVKSKFITLIITMFVASAAMLVSLAAILTLNLTGAIDNLMTQAKTPHFMQMHSGKIDNAAIERFAAQNNLVDEFQVLKFLNIDNKKIVLGKNSLSSSTQDNGFSTQSKSFDYIFDLDGNIINASNGELYVPVCYMQNNTAKLGDKAYISGKEFIIAGFLRDSQMNSMLSSSKRFLVSEQDFSELINQGNIEYLIEFRLNDLSLLDTFAASYIASKLPMNGPTITYPLFKMINAIADGIMISIILIVSALVVIISLLCIRFTLLTKIEDDYREIGVMKAIGISVSDIKKIYLGKYAVIVAVGCIMGFLLSFVFRERLLENIRLTIGKVEHESPALLFGLIGTLFIFFTIILFVNSVMRRFRKISASKAISFGIEQEKLNHKKWLSLSQNSFINTNIFLGLQDIFLRKKLYFTNLAILIFAVFIMIAPQNLYNTISSESFITYMGIGRCDMRIDIQQTNKILEKVAEIENTMYKDNSISKYTSLITKSFKTKMVDGSVGSIQIELGDHNIFPVAYLKGKAPILQNEIALSQINADELEKEIGSEIILITKEGEKILTVCGIYSDITNGGKTSKAVFTDNSSDIMFSVIYATLYNSALINNIVMKYADEFNYAKVTNIQEYIIQTYGQTLNSVKLISSATTVISIIIMTLVTLLFVKMLVSKDRYQISVMKAFCFTNSDIRLQYISRSVFILILGILIGMFMANTVGEMIIGIVISSFGASSFQFIVNPQVYLICPFIMICSVLAVTIFATVDVAQIKIFDNIKE